MTTEKAARTSPHKRPEPADLDAPLHPASPGPNGADSALVTALQPPGSPVTFCDGHRTVFTAASGLIQLAADILAPVQVARPRLAAGAPPNGPLFRADSDRNREGDGG